MTGFYEDLQTNLIAVLLKWWASPGWQPLSRRTAYEYTRIMKCQGRPENGLCPDNRNDGTVHNTIADLYLCHACEEYRWPTDKTGKGSTSSTANRSSSRKQTIKSSSTNNSTKGKSKKVTSHEKSKEADAASEAVTAGASTQQIDSTQSHYDRRNDSMNDQACPVCNESVANDEQYKYIECSCCKTVYHEYCTGLNSDTFQMLLKIVSSTGWVCHQCRQNYVGLQSALNKTAEELADMRTSIVWLFEELKSLKSLKHTTDTVNDQQLASVGAHYATPRAGDVSDDPNVRTSSMQVEIHRVLHDTARRKLNVVVTGLPETVDSETVDSESNVNTQDSEAFIKFCEENLVVKPPLSQKGCLRLGKRVGDRPRKLLVHLTSETNVASLLSASRMLQRTEKTKNFYINPDMSPAEAALAFEQRQKRRTARTATKRNAGSATVGITVAAATTRNSVTSLAAKDWNDIISYSNLSATSSDFHPPPSLHLAAHHTPQATAATTSPDAPDALAANDVSQDSEAACSHKLSHESPTGSVNPPFRK